jgi:hypothetical protein
VSGRIDYLAQALLAVTALLESRVTLPSNRRHLERMQQELQAELAVLTDDQENTLSA